MCKQISLQLLQGSLSVEANLMGDILQDDCLVLSCSAALVVGHAAQLDVCFQQQSFHVMGEVEYCQAEGDAWLVHFHLKDPDKLQTRMLLQLSEIEQYRQYLFSRGREISIDDAAEEWVKRYAEDFASEFDAEHQR